jgi:hypothetical protein
MLGGGHDLGSTRFRTAAAADLGHDLLDRLISTDRTH